MRTCKQLLLPMLLALCVAGAHEQASSMPKHGPKIGNGLIAYSDNTTGSFQIWAIDPDGSNPKALTALDQGIELAVHPAWSPDGSRLAFSGMKQGSLNVWVRNADGSLLQLTHTVSPISSMVPAWTADGKRIVFESNRAVPPAESTADDPYDIYSVDVATGTDIKRLTTATAGRTGGMGGKPSPCGKYLAFASDRDVSMQQGLYDIYVLKLNAKGLLAGKTRRLTWGIANQYSRSWSPDSKYLAFNSQVGWTGAAADKIGAGRIMTVEVDGGRLRTVTQTNDKFPAFSPGGGFPSLRGDVTPAWSPDGKRIAFASQSAPDGDFEVVTVRASDGKDQQRLTRVPGAHVQHVTVAWQPVLGQRIH